MATLEIIGFGCQRCVGLLKNTEEATRQIGCGDPVPKVTDYNRILALNPSALPALAIDGDIVVAGRVASPNEIRQLLVAKANAPEATETLTQGKRT